MVELNMIGEQQGMINEDLLNSCLDKIISTKGVYSTVMCVATGDSAFSWTGARGEMEVESKFFIASVTKLYITAVIMSLIEEMKMSLDDRISKYIPPDYMENLHIYKGTNYSEDITVKHLLANTSGLPDYFFYKDDGKLSAADSLFQGNDEAWGLDKTIAAVKKMKPRFPPGKKGKAEYIVYPMSRTF